MHSRRPWVLLTEVFARSGPAQLRPACEGSSPDAERSFRFRLPAADVTGADVPLAGNSERAQAPHGLRNRSQHPPERIDQGDARLAGPILGSGEIERRLESAAVCLAIDPHVMRIGC